MKVDERDKWKGLPTNELVCVKSEIQNWKDVVADDPLSLHRFTVCYWSVLSKLIVIIAEEASVDPSVSCMLCLKSYFGQVQIQVKAKIWVLSALGVCVFVDCLYETILEGQFLQKVILVDYRNLCYNFFKFTCQISWSHFVNATYVDKFVIW